MLPVALITLMGAALQAVGRTAIPVLAMGAGAAVKLVAEAILLGLPNVHIYGAPISTLCCNLTVLLIEAVALARCLPFRIFAVRDLFRPLAAALPGIGAGIALYVALQKWGMVSALMILPVLSVTVLVFGFLALRLGAVEAEDIAVLPAGERLCAVLKKCKLMR